MTTNIYCSGHLDELIHRAIVPFWSALTSNPDNPPYYLWLVRYLRCGEHLKLRLHGPSGDRARLQQLLTEPVEAFFDSLEEPAEPPPAMLGENVPPIDVEDRATTSYPDRRVVWTSYQRSFVSLGGEPLLDDDRYVARITCCLAHGCEIVLGSLVPDEAGEFPHRVRQTTLLKSLISGLAALELDDERRARYLAYHRDWLVRFALFKGRQDPEKATELFARFDRRVGMMTSLVETLRQTAAEANGEGKWGASLHALGEYVESFRDDPDYLLDPYTEETAFPAVFKAFHGLTNQLGLDIWNEAFAHHLLLSATTDGEPFPFVADPPLGQE